MLFSPHTMYREANSDPLFGHELWNCYDRTVSQNPRTNHEVEGWEGGFNGRIVIANSTIWRFVDKIQEEQSVVEMNLNQLVAGTPATPRRKKYRRLDDRLLSIVEDYETRAVPDYLLGIAQNIAFYVV